LLRNRLRELWSRDSLSAKLDNDASLVLVATSARTARALTTAASREAPHSCSSETLNCSQEIGVDRSDRAGMTL
ncbi:MAG: hypothetical protein K940chlam7_01600, partial [Chlamydiae bacterium]|nr:hypothetical protein [Chlamydiota bacterium]